MNTPSGYGVNVKTKRPVLLYDNGTWKECGGECQSETQAEVIARQKMLELTICKPNSPSAALLNMPLAV